MMYFANPTKLAIPYMQRGMLGYIDTPRQGNKRPKGVTWCADNGAFSNAFNVHQWWEWLFNNAFDAPNCAFAVAPDVVGDAVATLRRSKPFLKPMRKLGYPVAFVAQDGLENIRIPWRHIDSLFIGGSTEFKLGKTARNAAIEANRRGLHVHMGRVNSRRRLVYADEIGCHSADGTYLTFAPEQNLPKLLSWLHDLRLMR